VLNAHHLHVLSRNECAAPETFLKDSFTFFTFSYFFVLCTKKYENVKNVKLSLRRRHAEGVRIDWKEKEAKTMGVRHAFYEKEVSIWGARNFKAEVKQR